MNPFSEIALQLEQKVFEWEPRLHQLPAEVISQRRNSQNRNIKQIVGHMVDSAGNNLHRVIHLQYQTSPFSFPNYATYGNNDRWIALQNYQDEDWNILVNLWKFSNLHYAHVIRQVQPGKLYQEWLADKNRNITLKEMVEDYPRHFDLHLSEIEELVQFKK